MGQLENLMKLGMSEAEARQVMEDDKRIDRGEDLFPLSADQKKAEKKMRQADRKPTVYNLKPRERKPNEAKREIIQILDEALTNIADNVVVTNIERQIDFELDGVRYRVVLSAPRKQGHFYFVFNFSQLPLTARAQAFLLKIFHFFV